MAFSGSAPSQPVSPHFEGPQNRIASIMMMTNHAIALEPASNADKTPMMFLPRLN